MEENGIIIEGVGGLYTVFTNDGERLVLRAKGAFRREIGKLQVGDAVTVLSDENGEKIIGKVLPRRNSLLRPSMANLDRIFITIPTRDPEPDLYTVDKLTTIAAYNGISCTVVVTKSDLDGEGALRIAGIYRTAGFDTFVLCPDDREELGRLQNYCADVCLDEVCAFSGASGVGKSTLINRLFPSLTLKTGQISEKIARGKHTTRTVTLYPMRELIGRGSGFLADTPGFTMLDFERFDFFGKEDLAGTFVEFAPYLGKCRYTDCRHLRDTDCAVLAAVSEGKIPKSRHESYCALYEILKNKHDWDKK